MRRHGWTSGTRPGPRVSGELLRKHGAGDGRFYGQLGITAVAFGVGGSGQHGPQEYADASTIAPYYHALIEFLGQVR